MESKDSAAADTERSYEEFQPKTTFKLEACPVYELTVPDFKKEHLNVKLDQTEGLLKINGERPLGGNRWQQFSKTIPVSKDSKINDFNAKLSNGVLRVALPKTVTELDSLPQKLQEVAPTTSKTDGLKEKASSDVATDDLATKATKLGELMKEEVGIPSTGEGKEGSETKDEGVDDGHEDGFGSGHDDDEREQRYSSGAVARLRRPRWVVTIAVVVIAVVLIGAYTRFMLRTLSGEDDHQLGEL